VGVEIPRLLDNGKEMRKGSGLLLAHLFSAGFGIGLQFAAPEMLNVSKMDKISNPRAFKGDVETIFDFSHVV
jgi:hypothetical protein